MDTKWSLAKGVRTHSPSYKGHSAFDPEGKIYGKVTFASFDLCAVSGAASRAGDAAGVQSHPGRGQPYPPASPLQRKVPVGQEIQRTFSSGSCMLGKAESARWVDGAAWGSRSSCCCFWWGIKSLARTNKKVISKMPVTTKPEAGRVWSIRPLCSVGVSWCLPDMNQQLPLLGSNTRCSNHDSSCPTTNSLRHFTEMGKGSFFPPLVTLLLA